MCRLHDICTQRFFTMQKARKCPICKKDWTGKDFVGERAAVDTKEHAKSRSTSGINFRGESTIVTDGDNPDEAQGDDDDEG